MKLQRFLLQPAAYLAILVLIATSATYFLAAEALNPRSNFEGRNPPPPPAVVDAQLDALNLNNRTAVLTRFARRASAFSTPISAQPSTAIPSMQKWTGALESACGCC